MKITVPPEIERALTVQARKRGTTAELIALDSLRRRFVRAHVRRRHDEGEGNGRQTLADFLEGYVGVLHSSERVPGGARMSEESGNKFAQALIDKRRKGRL
ncbi:MAG: hypothetical protein ABSA52_20725 [Candidatus Binatia bacterium]|jgi:hypothetical protein